MKITFSGCVITIVISIVLGSIWYYNQPDVIAVRDKELAVHEQELHEAAAVAFVERNERLKNIPGMEDCNFIQIGGYGLVIRCPNSTILNSN